MRVQWAMVAVVAAVGATLGVAGSLAPDAAPPDSPAAAAERPPLFTVYPSCVGIAPGVAGDGRSNEEALAAFDWSVRGVEWVPMVDPKGVVYLGGWCGTYWKEKPAAGGAHWDRVNRAVVGPHNLLGVPGDPLGSGAAMKAHLAQVLIDVEARVPAGHTGFVCIDWESGFCWAQASDAQKAAWERHCRALSPKAVDGLDVADLDAHLRKTFNAGVRRTVEATVAECHRVRPGAKVGFYGQPLPRYYEWWRWSGDQDGGRSIIGAERAEMAWFPRAVDVLFPSLYWHDDNVAAGTRMVVGSVAEAQAWAATAGGVPVVPFVWWRYHDGSVPRTGTAADYLSAEAAAACIRLPWAMGCRGVVMYEWFEDASYIPPAQAHWRARWAPVLRGVAGAVQVPVVR